jgi:hypothetical protein
LLASARVSEADILAGHFNATRERFAASESAVLLPHDTTEFSYKRDGIEAVGKTWIGIAGAYPDGHVRHYTACEILMQSSLAVTTEGLALGNTAIRRLTKLLRFFAPFLIDKPRALDAASGVYLLGRKSDSVLGDREFLRIYNGLSKVLCCTRIQ